LGRIEIKELPSILWEDESASASCNIRTGMASSRFGALTPSFGSCGHVNRQHLRLSLIRVVCSYVQ
jgi:hypothetical protein